MDTVYFIVHALALVIIGVTAFTQFFLELYMWIMNQLYGRMD
jgi:hypothetical protein